MSGHRVLAALRGYPSVPNTSSTARDHLANERTFLAWVRTGVGLVLLGVGVERFARLRADLLLVADESTNTSASHGPLLGPPAKHHELHSSLDAMLARTLLGTGGATMVFGTWRYFAILKQLQAGRFRPNLYGILVLTTGSAAAMATIGWARYQDHEATIRTSPLTMIKGLHRVENDWSCLGHLDEAQHKKTKTQSSSYSSHN